MPIYYIRVMPGQCAVRAVRIALVVAYCSFNAGCDEGKPQGSPKAESEPTMDDMAKRDNDRSPPPPVNREKELVLNVGFTEPDQESDDPLKPVLFFAGNEVPISNASKTLQRESLLYQDLGIDLTEVAISIRFDAAVEESDRQSLIDDCRKVGFQKISIVEVVREASE